MAQVEYMSLNGKVVPTDEARIHILSPAVKYGANVFEGIRGYWNAADNEMYVFRLTEHLERLRFSMKVMRFADTYSVDYLQQCIVELIKANELREDTYIRLFAYVDEPDGEMTAAAPSSMAIAATPKGRREKAESGLNCAVSSWTRISDNAMPPRIKCVANYNNGRLAWMQAKADGYDNVILLTQRGTVAEGPGACLFMVRDGIPTTSTVASDILESITRGTVMQIFREYLGVDAVERDIGRTELYAAEEAFYCGTGHEILPIVTIDRHAVGDGTVGALTQTVNEKYQALVRGELSDHSEWRTPVYATASGVRA
ncbi:MAG: branched-chain amino acid transaminase [Acidiferrobacterales bacterium]